MITSTLTSKASRGVVAVLAIATSVLLMASGTAHADPLQFTNSLSAVGSDTIQDVDSALTGYNSGNDFTPIHSDAASGREQIASWDAFGTDVTGNNNLAACISPKAPGGSFVRPNGSGAGMKALSRAIDGQAWGTAGDACGGPKQVQGLIDFSRSSSGPSGSGTALAYAPFARDAASYAYYTTGTASAVSDLTHAELLAIYSGTGNGTDVNRPAGCTTGAGGCTTTHVVPCGIQTSSGTYKFWLSATGATASQEATATTGCNAVATATSNCATTPCRLEENHEDQLKAKGDAIAASPPSGLTANNEYIVGHSAGVFIAETNGVEASHLASGVTLGAISNNGSGTNLGLPYTGTAPHLAPSSTFYSDGTFGRFLYHIFDNNRINGLGNNGMKQLFQGTSAIICQSAAQTIVNSYGFLSIPYSGSGPTAGTCGDTTSTTGPLVAGAS